MESKPHIHTKINEKVEQEETASSKDSNYNYYSLSKSWTMWDCANLREPNYPLNDSA